MLSLDPSSSCDICYDAFSSIPGERSAAHSIPCGHVFCKGCLTSVSPRLCPLCRQPFALQNIRKLHLNISRPSDQDREMELIRQYLHLMDDSDEDGKLTGIATEITEWLAKGSGKEDSALSQVVDLKERSDRLRARHHKDKKRLQGLELTNKHLEKLSAHAEVCSAQELRNLKREVESSRARVASLQAHISRLENGPSPRSQSSSLAHPPVTQLDLLVNDLTTVLRDAMDLHYPHPNQTLRI